MDFVVDANILFAALIKDSITVEILLDEKFMFFAPEFLFEEFHKHEETIIGKAKRSGAEFNEIFAHLGEVITIVPNEGIETLILEGKAISPDTNDAQYFALALKLNCPIWSNDKRLKEQEKVPVYSTSDLVRLFFR